MIHCAWLQPPDGAELEVEAHGGDGGLELPLAVPLAYAGQVTARTGVLLWNDPAQGIAGFFHPRVRAQWRIRAVTGLRLVILKPGSGPGVVGLELQMENGAEVPVLAGTPYSETLLAWFRQQRELWQQFLGHTPTFIDYGFDR